jgi:hypothetical protein
MGAAAVRPWRRLATVLVFAIGVTATAATGSLPSAMDSPSASGSIRLDRAHPVALVRIHFHMTAEGTAVTQSVTAALLVDSIRASSGASASSSPATQSLTPAFGPARIIVSATLPGAFASAAPSFTPDPDAPTWQADTSVGGGADFSLTCGPGACDRTRWLIATLADPEAGAVDIDWHVSGSVNYGASPGPSGAKSTFTADEPILVPGPVPAMSASTEAETITLGATRPAAARVVEVTTDRVVPKTGANAAAVLTVDIGAAPGARDFSPVVDVFAIDGPGAGDIGSGPVPSPNWVNSDPFGDCVPGEPCTRRFLITFAYADTYGLDQGFVWRATVRRADLTDLTTPSALSAKVTRRYDVATQAEPMRVHFEGAAQHPARGVTVAGVSLATATTSTDPLARLLPVPAALVFRATPLHPQATPSLPAGATPSINPMGPTVKIVSTFSSWFPGEMYGGEVGGDLVATGNPMAAPGEVCRVASSCPSLDISIEPPWGTQAPLDAYHWSLTVSVFAYTSVPVTLTATQTVP